MGAKRVRRESNKRHRYNHLLYVIPLVTLMVLYCAWTAFSANFVLVDPHLPFQWKLEQLETMRRLTDCPRAEVVTGRGLLMLNSVNPANVELGEPTHSSPGSETLAFNPSYLCHCLTSRSGNRRRIGFLSLLV